MLEAGASAASWHIDCSRRFEPELFAIWGNGFGQTGKCLDWLIG
jgi:hypothetical protein